MKTEQEREPVGELRPGSFGVFVLALLVSVALFAAPAWAGSEQCIRADVKQSVRLPHGELLAPGTLKLCRQKLSPVSHLHHTTIDGRPVALLMSVSRATESGDFPDPVVVFHRTDDGHLELVGYSLPGGKNPKAHWFVQHGRKVKTEVRVSEPQILIAAAVK